MDFDLLVLAHLHKIVLIPPVSQKLSHAVAFGTTGVEIKSLTGTCVLLLPRRRAIATVARHFTDLAKYLDTCGLRALQSLQLLCTELLMALNSSSHPALSVPLPSPAPAAPPLTTPLYPYLGTTTGAGVRLGKMLVRIKKSLQGRRRGP